MKKTVFNTEGKVLSQVHPAREAYYKIKTHYYHVRSFDILHVNGAVINNLEEIQISEDETLYPCTKDEFEEQIRHAVFNLGIYKYVK